MVVVGKQREENLSEPIVANLVATDQIPWYKKPNLRRLYFILFPACMGIEITSGFDSQMINVIQIVYTWNKCLSSSLIRLILYFAGANKSSAVFGHPTGKIVDGKPEYVVEANLDGFLAAAYSLGAILSLPFVPWVNQRLGRRWTIVFGSGVSLVGALIQGLANGSKDI